MNISREVKNNVLVIKLDGRLDAHWADYVNQEFEKEVKAGFHHFILDLEELKYISSAGLGTFLGLKKNLQFVNGTVVLSGLSDFTKKVFKISNFDQLFPIFDSIAEAETNISKEKDSTSQKEKPEVLEQSNATYWYQVQGQAPSVLVVDGSIKKLAGAQYSKRDMIQKPMSDIKYAIGIGSLGDSYNAVKNTFGEMLVLNHNVFYLPTDGNDVPDFLITQQLNTDMKICTLFNAAFQGNFNVTVRFKAKDKENGISISDIYKNLFDICEKLDNFKGLFAIVICAETVKLLGASLKKSPIAENSREGLDILAKENLKSWLHFSVDPEHKNNILCAVGLGLKQKNITNFSKKLIHSLFHISNTEQDILTHNHGAIFNFMPLAPESYNVEGEITKIIQHGNCVSVQHLLEKSTFYEGVVGICAIGS